MSDPLRMIPEAICTNAGDFASLNRQVHQIQDTLTHSWSRLDSGWEDYAESGIQGYYNQAMDELDLMIAMLDEMDRALVKSANGIEEADKNLVALFDGLTNGQSNDGSGKPPGLAKPILQDDIPPIEIPEIDTTPEITATTPLPGSTTLQTEPIVVEPPPPLPVPGPDLVEQYKAFEVPPPDAGGMVLVPPTWIAEALSLRQSEVTKTEADLMSGLGLYGQFRLYQIQEEARVAAEQFAIEQADINGVLNGTADAFRHAYWNALMVREFGARFAQTYGYAHEATTANDKPSAFMDLWNNALGINIALQNPGASNEELADLITQAVESGQAVVIDENTQEVVYSK